MLSIIRRWHGRDDDQGFTLIELMVVVLIIAILLAIAIPTFLGARNSANARAAQSSLRNALTAEQTYWTNNQSFCAVTAGAYADSNGACDMKSIEPNLTWATAAPTSTSSSNDIFAVPDTVGTADDVVYLQAFSQDGNCYTVVQINDPTATGPATGYDMEKGACPSVPATAGTLPTINTGKASSDNTGTKWFTSW